MDNLKKVKLVYTIELLVFAAIFALLGTLILTRVWVLGGTFRYVFIFITMAGACYFYVDFVWMCCSKKRRAKNSMLDKALPLPATSTIFVVDIISLVNGLEATKELHQLTVGAVFLYLSLSYIIQAAYHYKHPLPLLLEEAKEADEEDKKAKEALEASKNASKEDDTVE